MTTALKALARPNIQKLTPYLSARDTLSSGEYTWLDANEAPGNGLNRYPASMPLELLRLLAERNEVTPEHVLVGNGSDELIDLLIRSFCEPGTDRMVTFPPTYGMYQVAADINAVEVMRIPLDSRFELDMEAAIPAAQDPRNKLVFVCSPNNPTGNSMDPQALRTLAQNASGLLVVDEAYIEFSPSTSMAKWLDDLPNVVVLRTLSKYYGLAGARIGYVLCNPAIREVLEAVKPPYNVNALSQQAALDALAKPKSLSVLQQELTVERDALTQALRAQTWVRRVWPSDANFLLVEVDQATLRWEQLLSAGFAVRNRDTEVPRCLRITIGSSEENQRLMQTLSTLTP